MSSASLNDHLNRNKRVFPRGISAPERFIYTAAQSWVSLSSGTHYNRGKNTDVLKPIEATPICTPGSEDAKCFGKFRRQADKRADHKPMRSVAVPKDEVLINKNPAGIDDDCSTSEVLITTAVLREGGIDSLSIAMTH